MRGTILSYDAVLKSGAASGAGGVRYAFGWDDWEGDGLPIIGEEVDFFDDGEAALNIVPRRAPIPEFSWKWLLFSLDGRLRRRTYWLRWLVPVTVLLTVAGTLIGALDVPGLSGSGLNPHGPQYHAALVKAFRPFYVIQLILLWPFVATQVKRLHDCNRSGWILMLYFVLAAPIRAANFFSLNVTGDGIWLFSLCVIYVMVVAAFALWLLFETLFLRGTTGPNRYGDAAR